MARTPKMYKDDGRDRLLPKFSLFIFDRSRIAALLWLCITFFGLLSYTTLLKREGFPSINLPYSIIAGAYVVDDAQKVDEQVAKPISDIVSRNSNVKTVTSQAQPNAYNVTIEYKEGTNANAVNKQLQQQIAAEKTVPSQAIVKFIVPKFGFTERGDDAVISLFSTDKNRSVSQLKDQGTELASFIKQQHVTGVGDVSIIDPFDSGVNPMTGQTVTQQVNFDRYGDRENNTNKFYDAVSVGVTQQKGSDVITLDDGLRAAVTKYNDQHKGSGYTAVVSASNAPDIRDQISELQRSLLEGLLAVLIIGSLIIAIRASIITVLSMATVIATTLSVLYLVGYSLNTITLFSLILCLGLIVDDTIIMVEALDAQRRRRTDPRATVKEATRKVSRAMVAATLTAALSFAPLLFVGGILGSFIRAIPVTVITSLLVSLAVALIFIPLFARYILLTKGQMGEQNVHEPAAGIEARIARWIGKPMLWAQHSKAKLTTVIIVAMVIGFSFVGAGGYLFQKVTFNIFPPSKDSNGLLVNLTFDPGTTIAQAEAIADKTNQVIGQTLGDNFKTASYYSNASAQNTQLSVKIISYSKRSVRAPELVKQVEQKLSTVQGAQVKVGQEDVGPPASAFTVRIQTPERDKAFKLAKDMNAYLLHKKLERPSGTNATITSTSISDPGTWTRSAGDLYVEVTANFDGTDTTTLVTLAKDAVAKHYNAAKLAEFGLDENAIQYDFGQESENQDSFKTLALAFPILLLVIYILLATQFRSLLQPLVIFMAIPFSLLGITLGLYLTDNAFSFFAMLGFFALIGLSLKNTILLTDYANQLRRLGANPVDAAVEALGERFRPLIATSLTAVCSLIPLAISSPFWEGLTVVLIGGLLSSTFLVIMVFPYYYLGAEFLRVKTGRGVRRLFRRMRRA